jgi:hypothetical protein
MQEREVALAQRDEVPLGAEVVPDGDRAAVARDREVQRGLAPSVRLTRSPSTSTRMTGAGSGRERTIPSTVTSSASVCGRPSTEKSAKTR